MIISHKYRFIFLKTRRTGGSTFEKAVSPYLGELDIATGSERDGTPRLNLDDHPNVTGHIPWWEIEQLAGPEAFESYFKFCFERHPYTKSTSEWLYKRFVLEETDASLLEWTNAHPVSDIKRYYHGFGEGELKFNVFQYFPETYIPQVRGLLAFLGIPPDAANEIHLKNTVKNRYHLGYNLFSSTDKLNEFRAIVSQHFEAEFKIFNYSEWEMRS